MSNPTVLAQAVGFMNQYKLEILGLCETRWNGKGEFQTNEGFTLLFSGKPQGDELSHGVGLLLTRTAKRNLLSWNPISERILISRFNSSVRKISLIQCYAPTDVAQAEDKLDFYDQLMSVCLTVPKGDILIITGDFNAQIGSDNQDVEHIMGKHGIGSLSENGELLIELCNNFNLIIGGSIFPHKRIHKVTWVSPDQRTENQIDHFLISRRWRRSLLDVRNRRGADIGSDHHLLIGYVQLKIAVNKPLQNTNVRRRFNVKKLSTEDTTTAFSTTLTDKTKQVHLENNNLEENWETVKNTLLNTAQETLGYHKTYKKPWISDATWKLITERARVKELINNSNNILEKQTLSNRRHKLNQSIKKSARHDKRLWKEDLARQAQIAADVKDTRELYRITKQLANQKLSRDYLVKTKQGTLKASSDQQLARWQEHFSDLLDITTDEEPPNENYVSPLRPVRISTEPPNMEEIVTALKSLKSNKAPGTDNIPADILKADTTTAGKLLHPIISQIWNHETLPSDWKRGLIVKIPKKGDLSNCDNWRGITLLNTSSKVLAKIVHSRISPTLEAALRPEQAGFRPQRSCVDHINTLRMIVEQSTEWRSNLYLVFVDFLKAFDKIKHTAIWSALATRRVPEKIIRMIKLFYNDASSQVLHKGMLSDHIPVRTGVRQGCVLSPLLFNIVLDDVMRRVTEEKNGLRWSLNNYLEDLDYADDICLLAHSFDQMQRKLSKLVAEAATVGLMINVAKTKSMRIFTNNIGNFSIQGVDIEDVEIFTYLGSVISKDGGADEDIKARINKANYAFSTLLHIWRSAQYTNSTKIRIFKSNVIPILLYGCETWKTSKTNMHRLQVFVNKKLRRILRIFWPNRISNEELWERTTIKPIEQEIKIRKWRWIGHTLRRDATSISRAALDWTPQGSRRRGRPIDTWRRLTMREIADSGKTWKELKHLAKDRSKWRQYIEALCFT